MISEKHVEVQTHLILNDEETEWLKAAMQNSFMLEESPRDEALRKQFFEALTKETPK